MKIYFIRVLQVLIASQLYSSMHIFLKKGQIHIWVLVVYTRIHTHSDFVFRDEVKSGLEREKIERERTFSA